MNDYYAVLSYSFKQKKMNFVKNIFTTLKKFP
jgi:hypothetical protein